MLPPPPNPDPSTSSLLPFAFLNLTMPPGLKRDDVVGQDVRDLIRTAAAAPGLPTPQPSTAALPPPTASGHAPPLTGTDGDGCARYVPIAWEQCHTAVSRREDIVLENVVLPAAVGGDGEGPAGGGGGGGGGGFAPQGPLATLHFRWVERESLGKPSSASAVIWSTSAVMQIWMCSMFRPNSAPDPGKACDLHEYTQACGIRQGTCSDWRGARERTQLIAYMRVGSIMKHVPHARAWL